MLGHEFVGEVIAHGPGRTDQFPVGTRVTSMPILLVDGGAGGTRVIGQHPDAQGSFGELLVVSELFARAVPAGVLSDAVALVDAFAVGEFYVRSSRITDGEIPIVIGAEAIGLSAVVALAARGIEPIIASDYISDRLDLAKGFGPHVLVNKALPSPFDVWQDVARERAATTAPVVCDRGRRRWSHPRARRQGPDHLPNGWYYEPTLLVEVDPKARIAQEEVFGPVPMAIPYEDDDDAVRIANDSIFGLSGAVFGTDTERARSMARRIPSGTISVNGGMYYGPDAPFGGYKQSGIGREMGVPGLVGLLHPAMHDGQWAATRS